MEYAEFDTERRRIIRAWGDEITDPEQLAAAVRALHEQASTISGAADQDRVRRYLSTLDDLVAESAEPESASVRQASDVLLKASAPEGTPAERRARAEAGLTEIARIAAAAPTVGERDAVLEMNETLQTIATAVDAPGDRGDGVRSADDQTARFVADPAMTPPGRIEPPSGAPASRPAATASPKAPVRDR